LGAAFLALASAVAPVAANAQVSDVDRAITVSIPAQSLSGALRQLAEASGLQLVYDAKITDGKSTSGVSGTMSSREALSRLLAGSGLSFQFSGDRTVLIAASSAGGAPAAEADGVRSGGLVTVEGVAGNMPYGAMVSEVNGTNGSRDVEATEGTGSYTTGATSIASKLPLTLRETAQSVSVVTSQQIEDQNLNSVKDILERMPGLTATPGPNGEEFSIYSRGFKVETYTIDGGAPISYAHGNRPIIDMSEFDSVQLLRGASGLFDGYGNPGGVVNLVRKKPLDHRQITLSADVGSFNFFREEFDITGPLTADKSLRGRFVAARQDNDYFYDVANSHKTAVYGTLEYDLTPTTLVTAGASFNWERNRPNQGGLPRYLDGGEIDFPRSTCLCPSANFDKARKTEFFGTLNQKLGEELNLKVNGVYLKQTVDASYYGISSSVVRGGGNVGTLGGYSSYNPSRQTALDFTFNGGFDLLGRHHLFVVGGNYAYTNNDGGTSTFLPSVTVPDIFNFDPDAYSIPTDIDPFTTNLRVRLKQYGLYASARLELLKWLHFNVGMRYNYQDQVSTAAYSFDPSNPQTSRFKAENWSRPAVGLTVDFLKNFTLYASHQNIYRPQTFAQFVPGNDPVPPITGSNDEIGLRFQSPSKKFNASISYYRVVQNNFLSTDYGNPDTSATIPVLNDTKSRGVDIEANGELFAGLQIAASYTYNKNSTRTSATNASPATSYAPKHKLKLWANYRPPSESDLNRFSVGFGIDAQSKAFSEGGICATPITDPNGFCPYPGPDLPFFIPYEFTTKGYTTLSARLGYRLFDNVELSLVGKNLTNVKTYVATSFQGPEGYNFYTAPFSLIGSVNVRF
jgi:TonB-dependent siderophore receptor